MKQNRQMSESIELGIILAIAGGFMDAYSYICRDEVFANAQTGNMLLFGVHLSEGNISLALRYFFPVLAFAAGIAMAELFRYQSKRLSLFHWRQLAVFCEALILAGVCLMPQSWNLFANSFTSLACGIQVECFRKIHGNGIATTMCIGNLRSGTQNICEYLENGEKESLRKGLLYFGIILFFVAGAVLGNFLVKLWEEKAILVCTVFLLLAGCMMFIHKENTSDKQK